MFLVFLVQGKYQNSLLPIIHQHCDQGSTVISDSMASYVNYRNGQSHIENMGYDHFWVNHSNEWVNQNFSDVHTNTVERGWRNLKSSISVTKRTLRSEILESYINTFMIFNNSLPEHAYEIFMSILKDYFK